MSARRARIKPVVTSFPARRKNNVAANNTKKPRKQESVGSKPMDGKSKETMQAVLNTVVPLDVSDDDFIASLTEQIKEASVSEAEDDSRRVLRSGGGPSTSAAPRQGHDSDDSPHSVIHSLRNRDVKRSRNESVSSFVSQVTPQPGPSTSAVAKDKNLSKSRRVATPRRVPAMRRLRETGKKEPLTVHDLMFTHPKSNPMVPDEAQLANEKEEAARKAAIAQGKNKENQTEMEIDVAPVPQIKLGPDGEIMLDKQSLVIKQSKKRKVSPTVVHEGPSTASTSSGYRRTKRTALWTEAETLRFFRALASMGTDFLLMEKLFPERTRRDLKLKFKKEERVNTAQVEKALRASSRWDATRLENEFQTEREKEIAEEKSKQDIINLRKMMKQPRRRVPKSLAAKAFGESVMRAPDNDEPMLQRPKAKTQKSTASSQSATTRRVMPNSKSNDMSTLPKKDTKSKGKAPVKQPPKLPKVPKNLIEGSLVVYRSVHPDCPPNMKLRTFVAKAGGRLSPITLPPKFLKTVVTYMKTGVIPNDMSAGSVGSAGSAKSTGPAESAGSAGSAGSAKSAGPAESAGSAGSAESVGSMGSAASSSNAANQDSRPCPTDSTPAVI